MISRVDISIMVGSLERGKESELLKGRIFVRSFASALEFGPDLLCVGHSCVSPTQQRAEFVTGTTMNRSGFATLKHVWVYLE